MLKTVLVLVASYVVGSIPFGFIVGKLRGVDLRGVGSGNVGATNVYRVFGLSIAIFVFILDVCKGFVGARILPALWPTELEPDYLSVICGIAAIIGSVASVFMRFRGGKGVAAAVGVFLGLQPVATGIGIGVWLVIFAITRLVSLGSICGAVALPVLILVFDRQGFTTSPVFYLAVVVAALVILRHRSNIRRLRRGTEGRISRLEEKAE
jgi:glycerol-3-phosphate acyltransferase PlsY